MTDNDPRHEPGVATKLSPRSVADTVARLTDLIGVKGLKLFAVIDQAEAAGEEIGRASCRERV